MTSKHLYSDRLPWLHLGIVNRLWEKPGRAAAMFGLFSPAINGRFCGLLPTALIVGCLSQQAELMTAFTVTKAELKIPFHTQWLPSLRETSAPSRSLTIHNTVKTLLPFRFEVSHAASAPGEMSCLLHTSQESRKGWQTALFGSQAKLMSVTLSPAAPVQCWPQLWLHVKCDRDVPSDPCNLCRKHKRPDWHNF